MQSIGIGWILFASIWAFSAMGIDKRQAQKKSIRIRERNLWLFALLGGGIGAYIGMQAFRHKTRHTNFRIGFLLLAIVYLIVLFYLFGFEMPKITLL